jgi:AmmeMemoRadiSam system protein B
MPAPDRPRLRPTITGHVDPQDGNFIWLYDSARISRQTMRLRRDAIPLLELFNGQHTILDMQIALMRAAGGQMFPSSILTTLAETLDQGLFLEGPRLQERYDAFLRSPVREPACIGSYEGEPEALRRQLQGLFTHPKGPGTMPRIPPPLTNGGVEANATGNNPPYPPFVRGGAEGSRLRGALIPHIDFTRGGPTFAWGFKELVEQTDATTFVIIGTSHYSSKRYILTRKHFRTPLGVAETDGDYVDRIAAIYGERAFEDEVAHLPEHSIEFEVIFLQHCLDRPFRIVPLLVGSFQDCVARDTSPHEQADIYLMIQALKRAEAESREKVCYISSGDLAHIGPKFGDPQPVHEAQLNNSRSQDHALLKSLEDVDRNQFFRIVKEEADERRICGFPPTYTLLSVLQPDRGKLLHYDQYVEPNGFESVSFASLAFYGSEA